MPAYAPAPSPPVVVVDLETTGLDPDCHVMQIAAKCGDREYSAYVLPGRPIHPQAAARNQFSVSACGGRLYVRGQPVPTTSLYEAVRQLIGFLRSLAPSVVLVAHGGHNFDSRHLLKAARWAGGPQLAAELQSVVAGFGDTLPIFQQMYPTLAAHGLEAMCRQFLPGSRFQFHDALGDVRALDHLIKALGVSHAQIYSTAAAF